MSDDPHEGVEKRAYAIGKYALGDWSLGTAASHVGVSRIAFAGTLRDCNVQMRLGPESPSELKSDMMALRENHD